MFIRKISIIFILVCQKLRSVGPVQQKIQLPLPYKQRLWKIIIVLSHEFFAIIHFNSFMMEVLIIYETVH